MATTLTHFSTLLTTISLLSNPSLSSPLIDQLNQPPPPNFLATVTNTCLHHPSLLFCNSTSFDLTNIFKSTVVAAHLCNLSKNPLCPSSFFSIDLHARPKLAPLYLSFSFFWNYCPLSVQSINLSNNSLAGPFPSQILNCTQIRSLDLSHNMLSGPLPLRPFTPLTNLSHLNLSYNQFSPEIDAKAATFLKRFKDSSFIHSGLLQSDHKAEHKFRATTTATAILLLVGVSALAASAAGCLAWRIGKRHEFSERALRMATDGFCERRLVERGEEVEIYGGRLRDGREVEIKMQRGEALGEFRRRFVGECRVLVKVRHRNLVRVLGWCDEREMRAVVMGREKGESAEEWLLRRPPWKQRMKVAVEVVEAMRFLEEEWPRISCDVRGHNVMVTEGGEPLIMKLTVHDQPSSSSREAYKFGVFLLELITNKHPREEFEGSESKLVEWTAMHQHEKLRKVIDEKMKLSATAEEEAKQSIEIALICTDLSTDSLLTVAQISTMLRTVYMSPAIQPVVDRHRHRTRNKKRKEMTEGTHLHRNG